MTLILSGTDGLSDIDGSAATPAIRGTDANTGIFFGTDTVGIATGGTTAVTVAADQSVTFAQAANLPNTFGFKNRIINGGMVISQRNAGASVTPASSAYTLDRWQAVLNVASKFSVQQSSTTATGFSKSLVATSTSAYSIGASEYCLLQQSIEGFNIADLGWGTANAQTVTLSFQVRSSLTGTFGGVLANSNFSRCYPFTYTISSANTFESKTVTIAGDTSGTWDSTNGAGILVNFSLGSGSTVSGTAGAWAGTLYTSATGATSVVGTNGATFYITGVQLEKGSTATSFDYRPYGTELALCQRYFEMSYDIGTAPATATTTGIRYFSWSISGASNGGGGVTFQVPKRTTPTIATYDGAGTANNVSTTTATTFTNGRAYFGAQYNISTNGFTHQGQSTVGNVYNFIHFTASSEL
jgi:hypothetical protein